MSRERNPEEFKDASNKWRIVFDTSTGGAITPGSDDTVTVIFFKQGNEPINEDDIGILKRDVKDLGKLRIYKTAKSYLEE